MPINSLAKLCWVFILSSCSSYGGWQYQEISNAGPSYSCARIKHEPTKRFNGLALEFQKGAYGVIGYVSVPINQIAPSKDYPKYSVVTLYLAEEKLTFWGYLEEGCQRLKLPEDATHLIIEALASDEKVAIALTGYYSEFFPENFRKFSKVLKV